MRTEEPWASKFAIEPGLVSIKSPEKMAVESGFSLPLTHTPPLLRNIAEPESAAKSDSGRSAHIIQHSKLRTADTLIPQDNFAKSWLLKSYPGVVEASIGSLDNPAAVPATRFIGFRVEY